MISATAYRYYQTLRRNPTDTFSMLARPLLSTALFAIFAATYLAPSYGVAFMIISVAVVNVFTNAIQGASYETREEIQGLRLDVVRLSPGGFPAFVNAHALIQTFLAAMQSLVIIVISIPFVSYRPIGQPMYLLAGVGLLLGTSFLAAMLGAQVTIRRNNFLAVSFTSVLLITFAGAFYPIEAFPSWAATIARCNPVTYLVDLIRVSLFNSKPLLAPSWEICVCVAFLAVLSLGAVAFSRQPFGTSAEKQR